MPYHLHTCGHPDSSRLKTNYNYKQGEPRSTEYQCAPLASVRSENSQADIRLWLSTVGYLRGKMLNNYGLKERVNNHNGKEGIREMLATKIRNGH